MNGMRSKRFIATALVLGACLTGCAGGTHAVLPAQSGGRAGAAQHATITIMVPKATGRKAQYISPATQSIAISVYDSTHTTLQTTANQNITTGAPGCTTPTPISPLTCAISISLAPGSYAFDFTTYDGLLSGGNPTGNQLSANVNVPYTIVAGAANNIAVSLGGIPVSAILAPSATSVLSGNDTSGYSWGSTCPTGAQSVSVFGVDADGNYILGPGAPSVALSSANAAGVLVSAAGSNAPNAFDVTCLAMAGTVDLVASATPASGTGTSAISSTIPTTATHTVAGTITEYGSGMTASATPLGIAAGPDGALWFTENSANKIGRIDTSGNITEYSAGLSAGSGPMGITVGSDGALWFTEYNGGRIGRITTSGVITEYSSGISGGSYPVGITAGPDGALWFTEYNGNRIGRITTSGVVTQYSTGITMMSNPYYIVAGPDGALWFTEFGANQIGRITTSGVVTEYSSGITSVSFGITAGPDGALWFTEYSGNRIGRITTAGVVTEYSTGMAYGGSPSGIATGPDGALWFVDSTGNKVGRITTSGVITEYSTGLTASSSPYGIAAGPDGALWFTEQSGTRIGRVQ